MSALRGWLLRGLPAGVSAALLSEARIFAAALRSLARRPLAPVQVNPGSVRFGAMETSGYGHVVTMLLLLLVLEAPAVHFILGGVMQAGALRAFVRCALLASSLYLGVWLIGDLRLLRETPGVLLGRDALTIELGARVNGALELRSVTGAEPIGGEESPVDDSSRAIRITPQPRPNSRLRLSSAVSMRGLLGLPLRGERLELYVDDPAGLVSAIEAAILRLRRAE